MSSLSGSPTVRITVARSIAVAGGCGMRSRPTVGVAMGGMLQLLETSKSLELPNMPSIRLSQRQSYGLVAGVIALSLISSGTPSPLYETYRELWGFSPVVLTLIYATYAFGVLASLLLAGRLSDEIGRRPVLLASLGTLMVTSALFAVADSTVWLFVARGIQGLATGLALGAASAALLDLHPT